MPDKIMVYIVINETQVYGELDEETRTVRLPSGRTYKLTADGRIRIGDNIYIVYNAFTKE